MDGDDARFACRLTREELSARVATDQQVTTKSHGAVHPAPLGHGCALLEPAGTTIMFYRDNDFARAAAVFSLEGRYLDPFSETFLRDLAWSADGRHLGALTTHGQLFIFSNLGELLHHTQGPTAPTNNFKNEQPVSICSGTTPAELLLLTHAANVYSINLEPGQRCFAHRTLSFARGYHCIGRALQYNPQAGVLVLVGDGQPAGGGGAPGSSTAPASPSISVWSFQRRGFKLLAAQRGARPVKAEAAVPHGGAAPWRVQCSPAAGLVGVWAPGAGWRTFSCLDCKEAQLQGCTHADASVTSCTWLADTLLLAAWEDGTNSFIDFSAATQGAPPAAPQGRVLPVHGTLPRGSALACLDRAPQETDGVDGVAAAKEGKIDLQRFGSFAALEAVWEDVGLAQKPHSRAYIGAADELVDRKGSVIHNKFGVTCRIVGWRLTRLRDASPTELIMGLMPEGQPVSPSALAEALEIARDADMPASTIHKRAWDVGSRGAAEAMTLTTHLGGEDLEWLAHEALALHVADCATLYTLLSAALHSPAMGELAHAVQAVLAAPEQLDAVSAVVAQQCSLRLRLLALHDLLETYQQLHSPMASVEGLRALLASGVAAAAAEFARNGAEKEVRLLFERHARCIGAEAALHALSALPESLPPGHYYPVLVLLSLVSASNDDSGPAPAGVRALDFVEQAGIVEQLMQQHGAAVSELPEAALAELAGSANGEALLPQLLPTVQQLNAWVLERINAIDDATGLLPVALGMSKWWAGQMRDQDDRLRAAAEGARNSLHMLVWLLRCTEVLDADKLAWVQEQSARAFISCSVPAQVLFVLHCTFPAVDGRSDVSKDVERITQVASPALSVLTDCDTHLSNVLQMEFPSSPAWAVSVFRADLAAGCLLFSSPTRVGSAALTLINSLTPDLTTATGIWTEVLRLINVVRGALCTPQGQPGSSPSALPTDLQDRWNASLARAEETVCAARVVQRLGGRATPYMIGKLDMVAACGFVRMLLTTAAAAAPVGEEEDLAFSRMWTSVRDLQGYAFEPRLSLKFYLKEMLRAALLAQRWAVAERFMQGVPPQVHLKDGTVHRIIRSCTHEIFSYAASADASDPYICAAIGCLSLRAHQDPHLQGHLNLVHALRTAATDLGVPVDIERWKSVLQMYGPPGSTTTSTASLGLGSPLASPVPTATGSPHPSASEKLDSAKADLFAAAVAATAEEPGNRLPYVRDVLALLATGPEDETSPGAPLASAAASFSKSTALVQLADALAMAPGALESAAEVALEALEATPAGSTEATGLASRLLALLPAGHAAQQPLAAYALAHCSGDDLAAVLAGLRVKPVVPVADATADGGKAGKSGPGRLHEDFAGRYSAMLEKVEVASMHENLGSEDTDDDVIQLMQCLRECLQGAEEGASTACCAAPALLCALQLVKTRGEDAFQQLVLEEASSQDTAHNIRWMSLAVHTVALQLVALVASGSAGAAGSAEDIQAFWPVDPQAPTQDIINAAHGLAQADPAGLEKWPAHRVLLQLQEQLEEQLRASLISEHLPGLSGVEATAEGRQGAALEMAKQAGIDVAAGRDGAQTMSSAERIADAYGVDLWHLSFQYVSSILVNLRPDPSQTKLAESFPYAARAFEKYVPELMTSPDQLLWYLFARVLPDLDSRAPVLWLLLLEAVAKALAASGESSTSAHAAIQQLKKFVHRVVSTGAPLAMLPALLPGACRQVMQPLWRVLPVPEGLVQEDMRSLQPDLGDAQAALFQATTPELTAVICSALEAWPQGTALGGPLCKLEAGTVQLWALVKLLSAAPAVGSGRGGAADRRGTAFVADFCRAALKRLPVAAARAVLEFAVGEGPCPVRPEVARGGYAVQEPHPAAKLHLLQSVDPHVYREPCSLHVAAHTVFIWAALHPMVSSESGADGDTAQASSSGGNPTVWLATDMDASCAATLATAEGCVRAAREASDAGHAAKVVCVEMLRRGVALPVLAQGLTEVLHSLRELSGTGGPVADTDAVLIAAYGDWVADVLGRAHGEEASDADAASVGIQVVADLEQMASSLSGPGAAAIGCCSVLREAVLGCALDAHITLMRSPGSADAANTVLTLLEVLSSQDAWEDCNGRGASRVWLLARTRSVLGLAGTAAVQPCTEEFDSIKAADTLFARVLGHAQSAEDLRQCFQLLSVWEFGYAAAPKHVGESASAVMHNACLQLALRLWRQGAGNMFFNLLNVHVQGVRVLGERHVRQLLRTLRCEGAMLASLAVALLTNVDTATETSMAHTAAAALKDTAAWDVQGLAPATLMGLAVLPQPETVKALLTSEAGRELVLTALRRSPVRKNGAVHVESEGAAPGGGAAGAAEAANVNTGDAERGHHGVNGCNAHGLAGRSVHSYAQTPGHARYPLHWCGPLFASVAVNRGDSVVRFLVAEVVAEFVGMHPGLRDPLGVMACLRRYLTVAADVVSKEERADARDRRSLEQETVIDAGALLLPLGTLNAKAVIAEATDHVQNAYQTRE